VWDGKDNMSVRYIKHVPFNFFGPSDSVVPTAGRTEPVFAIVKYLGDFPARWTGVNIYPKSCSPACSYSLNCFVLFRLDKVLWLQAVIIPPAVKEMSKAIFLLAKPVMLLSCMNSTFTHAAIVFARSLSTTLLEQDPDLKANLHFCLQVEGILNKLFTFYCWNFIMKDHKVNLLKSEVTQDNLFSSSTISTFWYRIKYQFTGLVKFDSDHVNIEYFQAVSAGEVDFHW
jgi:hypothetical protein